MLGRLLLLFIIVPLVDAFLLIHIGGWIGGWNTIALVIATGTLGAWLFKLEGGRAWRKWQESLAAGQLPQEGILGGALLLVGGALLITPGVLTDLVGLLLLLPPTRIIAANLLRPMLKRRFESKMASATTSRVRVVHFGGALGQGPSSWAREPAGEDGAPEQEAVVIGRRVQVVRPRPRERQIIDVDFEVSSEDS